MNEVLPRQIPHIVHEIDAVLSRMHPFNPKRSILEEVRRNFMSGYNGEKQIDYFLKTFNKENCFIFAGIRLEMNGQAFQIDTMIVTPFFILIIESKNIAGILTFEKDSTQVTRELNGNIQGFKNPIVQVARQRRLLLAWIKKFKFPEIPVIDLVGIADRRTIVKTTSDNRQIFNKLIYADVLEDKFENLEAMFTTKQLTTRQQHKLNKLLLEQHTPAPPSILKTYGISDEEIIKGVQCPICKQFHMIRQVRRWFCCSCCLYSRNAHRTTIRDYFLIYSTTISNQQCRDFLQIDNCNISKKILTGLNLPTSGSNKTRLYHRPKDLFNT